jgi:DNA polymerase-3 subunit delta
MKTPELASWINKRAAYLGGHVEPRAIPALTGLIGNNLRLLDSELRKLVAYAGDRPVTPEDVHALVSLARDASVFTMVDAAAEGRATDAINEYRRLVQAGEPPQRFLAMVARQFRLILQARDLRERGVPQSEIVSKLRVHPYVADRVLRQAAGYRIEQLREAYRLLIEADLNIKRGVYDDETALELLIYELATARAASQKPRAPARGRPGYSTPRTAPKQLR